MHKNSSKIVTGTNKSQKSVCHYLKAVMRACNKKDTFGVIISEELMTDDELIEKTLSGDEEAFKMLVEKYKTPLYSYAFNMLSDEGRANDVFQEVFIKVFKNMGKYNRQGKFKAWVFKMANNLIMDNFRKKQFDPLVENMADKSGDCPAELLDKKEDFNRLNRALASLKPEDRQIIYLKHYGSMTFAEIADISNLPLGTVLAKANRSLKKLRRFLGEQNA